MENEDDNSFDFKCCDSSEYLVSYTKQILEEMSKQKPNFQALEYLSSGVIDFLNNENKSLNEELKEKRKILENLEYNLDNYKEIKKKEEKENLEKCKIAMEKEEKLDKDIKFEEGYYKRLTNALKAKQSLKTTMEKLINGNNRLKNLIEGRKKEKELLAEDYHELIVENINHKNFLNNIEVNKIKDIKELRNKIKLFKLGSKERNLINSFDSIHSKAVDDMDILVSHINTCISNADNLNIVHPLLNAQIDNIISDNFYYKDKLTKSVPDLREIEEEDNSKTKRKLKRSNSYV